MQLGVPPKHPKKGLSSIGPFGLLQCRSLWAATLHMLAQVCANMQCCEMEADQMVEFQTIQAEKVKFGRNNFLEVARKKAIAETGENEFLSISRGYYLSDGTERFNKSLTIPDEEDVKKFIAENILKM